MGKYTWLVNAFLKTSLKEKAKMIKGFLGSGKYYRTPRERVSVDMKSLVKCALCPNMCKFECPSLRVTKKETYSPAKKAEIAYFMERGLLDWNDPATAEVAYMCTNCDGCRQWCPMDISTGKLLKGVRADIVEHGHVLPELKEFNERVLSQGTTFTKETFKKPGYHVEMKNPEVFYYIGCVMAEKKPEAVMANISLLKKLGIPFSTLAMERQCCGGPSTTVGFRDTTRQLARQNLELFEKSGARTVITDCPACYDTIAHTYPELGLSHGFTVKTTTVFYKELIEQGRLVPSKEVPLTITYHDPCIAARGFGDVTSARYIFERIPGLVLKEPFLNREETQCCGMGGVSHVHHPYESEAIGSRRLEQLLATGAEKIVTACPACEEGFIIATGGDQARVMDIAEILDMAT